MKYSLMALTLLAFLPATLQAATGHGHPVASGTIRFIGEITAPACTIKQRNEGLISNCFGIGTSNNNGAVTTSLNNMPPELVSNVTTESVNNDHRLKNITISYK
ncbi:Uncharacterised protein [Serratia grimesii]|jgi:hypothetical protein|uniref:hypothetical protein n=1 Tax=Serratia grimesii TaxID=82995 RepID=UPI00076F3DCA|nr:hypothetical protein [Serratia grimesii]CAI0826351.1 Uncharacterised protein [Serratia grimesii]CAI0863189.1 Uncharacterised protein [Serratia grimesii]CAI2425463.1 Uncharacterised protein [Serratia grimesii]CUW20327.1 Uncharacterised protein [Serratia grimesii]SMZ56973.1 Uncharacterised protein [Serratia grimesii]